jgi:hypothetical protein
MAIQLSVAVRNARLDAIETVIGTGAKLQIYSGTMPANAAASATGTKLAEITLATDWAAAAASGSKNFNNTPLSTTGLSGAAGGTNAGYFRLVASDGTTCGMQGTVTITGGGGDMTVDNLSIASGQAFNVTGFSLTDANA